jgi:CBS domain-containing protein
MDWFQKETMMQTVSQVMSRNAQFVSPGESLQRAAQMMGELDVGALPVCDGERLVGMVTDRDIAVRGIAAGKAPQSAHVDEVMTADVRWCFEDQPLDEVMTQMADSQVRRVPVVSHDDQHRLVGMVALADLATRAGDDQAVERVVEKVSAPSGGPAGSQSGSQGATGKNANGVPEALTGIDQRPGGEDRKVEVAGVSGQPRIDTGGEPLHNPNPVSHDPADRGSLAEDVDGRKPPSKPSNAV